MYQYTTDSHQDF